MNHVIVWEFRVREGCEPDFEEVYGSRGDWALLFGRSPEYRGTELLRDSATPRRYLTVDRWTSAEAFDDLRCLHGAEYDALDARCESWTETEMKFGSWTAMP